VTSAVDGEVLGVLARADAEFTVPELRIRLGRSTEGIRRALERLAEQGIVIRRSIGRATSYQLNRGHLAAPAIIELAELPATLRLRISQEIESWARPPVYAALFGSAARQQMRPDSDIDILLVADEIDDPVWEEQVADLARAVTTWTGNDARPLVFSTEEIRGRSNSEAVLRAILDEGVPLAGDRRFFQKLIAA
jgi:UTP:GlnB (protein PII) uridylyltransferase